MRSYIVLLCLLGISFAQESNVIDLDATNFDSIIKENNLILVEFYAPWCGHCKKLVPEYEKAADELKGVIAIAKMNADEENNRPVAARYGIKGFPTLKVFRNGGETVSDYEGERTAEAMVSFLKKQNRPAVTTLSSEDVSKFATEDKVVIVGFFENTNQPGYSEFKQVAETLRNKFSFGEVIGATDLAQFELTSLPAVILFKTFDEGKNVLTGDITTGSLNNFIESNSLPIIAELSPENFRNYAESPLPLVYLFADSTVSGQRDTYAKLVEGIAKQTKGKLNWVTIDFSKYARHGETLGLSGKVVPSIAIEKIVDGLHFAFDEKVEITTEAIESWVASFLNNELTPTIKSEEIPASNDGPVKVVVANSFDAIVNDPTKDVLVEFYAPWCGHCKKLVPIYEELGTTLASSSNIVIAKIDATANDINKKFGVKGFPTLKFFPANNKDAPIEYNGDRSLADLTKFVNEHSTGAASGSKDAKDEL